MASAFISYQVKIAGTSSGNHGVYTTIADTTRLIDVFICKLWELINGCMLPRINDDGEQIAQAVGLTIECCDDDKVATLQLCCGGHGIVIQLLHLEEISSSLTSLLADNFTFIFVGVGIREACAKLERDYGLKCKSMMELAPMASRVCGKSQFFDSNLEELAHEIIGINIEKPTIPNLSLWGARELRTEQIDYAITKAYASYSIGNKLIRGK